MLQKEDTQRLRGYFNCLRYQRKKFSILEIENFLFFMGRKTSTIPKATAARILIGAGAKRVSAGGVDAFTEVLTDIAVKMSKDAWDIAKHAGRKTVHEGDVRLAAK